LYKKRSNATKTLAISQKKAISVGDNFIIYFHCMEPKYKSGFTLIELMIVVVIVSLLAVVTLPKFATGPARANDAARRADLKQIAAAIMGYKMERKAYPPEAAYLSQIEPYLSIWGIGSIPKDPIFTYDFVWVAWITWYQEGDYAYIPVMKDGVRNGWFVLMTPMETHRLANYVVCSSGEIITTGTKFSQILYCDEMIFSGDGNLEPYIPGYCKKATPGNPTCYYTATEQLRYIIKY
jgi:prepilin-type N-terminal cleavage/methylation domain-containing protein